MGFFKKWIAAFKQRRNVQKLIDAGILTPVESFEQYSQLVSETKRNAEHRLFTNCFLMPDEVKRFISMKTFYRVASDNGLIFVSDEGSYYYSYLYVDLDRKLAFPRLDRNALAENVYLEGRMTNQQESFGKFLKSADFERGETYWQINLVPQLTPERYWKRYNTMMKFLENDAKHVCIPSNKQLKEFEQIYRSVMATYIQKKYTMRERRKQRDNGYISCISDDAGHLYAIRVSAEVHGGVIAAKEGYASMGYAPALLFAFFKTYYENMPQDPQQCKEYIRSWHFSKGWIATTNTASLRLHKALGMDSTGKAMDQYILTARAL